MMSTKATQYPPPFSYSEVTARPTDPEGERIEAGVIIVGGGPAGLSCAIRLGQLLEDSPKVMDQLGDMPVVILEKGKHLGSHLLSGSIVDPCSLISLFRGRAVAHGRTPGERSLSALSRSK